MKLIIACCAVTVRDQGPYLGLGARICPGLTTVLITQGNPLCHHVDSSSCSEGSEHATEWWPRACARRLKWGARLEPMAPPPPSSATASAQGAGRRSRRRGGAERRATAAQGVPAVRRAQIDADPAASEPAPLAGRSAQVAPGLTYAAVARAAKAAAGVGAGQSLLRRL